MPISQAQHVVRYPLKPVNRSSNYGAIPPATSPGRPACLCYNEKSSIDPISGLVAAIRDCDMLQTIIALTAVLSEFMPVLLSNIPYRITQTEAIHAICTWTAAAILCWMILVLLLTGLYVRWPDSTRWPDTIAGLLYYVADSPAVHLFEGRACCLARDWHHRSRDGREV